MDRKIYIKSVKKIPGLFYISDIYDLDDIINNLDEKKWFNVNPRNPNSRRVQHYGYSYNYRTSNVSKKCDTIPDILLPIRDLLGKICKIKKLIPDDYIFNQCIINRYETGQGIGKHIDTTNYGSVIGCYTAKSGCYMVFTRNTEKVKIYVKPNSLYIMSGEARYNWYHQMLPVKTDLVLGQSINRKTRISLTFRNVSNTDSI